MSGRTPTWGSVGVIGLAGFSTGLLVAAVLVAGRTPVPPARVSDPEPAVATSVHPVTVTVTGVAPAPSTVIEQVTSPPLTTTTYVEVTVTSTETSSSTTSSTPTTVPTDPRAF